MKFNELMESTHVSTNLSIQVEYSANKQAKILAASNLVAAQRKILTWYNYIVLLSYYVLVVLHVKPAPKAAEELIAQYNAEAKAKMEQAIKEQAAKAEVAAAAAQASNSPLLSPVPDLIQVSDPKTAARNKALQEELRSKKEDQE